MPRAATGYRFLLRTPGAAAFFLTAAAGRVGIAMTGLGLVWLLHARTGSYGTAGLAAAGFALAEALIGPHLARLIDRFGQTRVLPFCLIAHAAAVADVLASTTAAAQIAAATCAGAVVPQFGALSGARWAHLLRGERLASCPPPSRWSRWPTLPLSFSGPSWSPRSARSVTRPWPAVSPRAWFSAGERRWPRSAGPRPGPPASAPDMPAPHGRRCCGRPFLLLALLNLAIGLFFGTMGVSVSSFATCHGVPGAAAAITAAAGLSGLLSGWAYGLRRIVPHGASSSWPPPYPTGAALLLPFAPSAIWLGAAAVATEVAVPPTLVLLNVLTEKAVHPAALTQAFTWNNSASAAGSAVAASLARRVADAWGASAALAQAPAAGRLDLAPMMGRWMANAGRLLLADADALVPVPLHWRRQWWRRFNQSALLAEVIGKASSRTVAHGALKRVKATPQQVGLDKSGRALNVQGAFRVPPERRPEVAGRKLLLVDDVLTSGATLDACARALFRGGAATVDAVGICSGCDTEPQSHITDRDMKSNRNLHYEILSVLHCRKKAAVPEGSRIYRDRREPGCKEARADGWREPTDA